MEHNMKNIFLEKSCAKCGGETIPRAFDHISEHNSAYLWINSLKFYTFCFYYMPG